MEQGLVPQAASVVSLEFVLQRRATVGKDFVRCLGQHREGASGSHASPERIKDDKLDKPHLTLHELQSHLR